MSYVDKLPYSVIIKEKLRVMIQLLLSADLDCSRIILFGSYARMEQKAGSDLDVLVLTTSDVPREIRGELCAAFEELGADLIFYKESVFNDSRSLLAQRVREEGILLWKK